MCLPYQQFQTERYPMKRVIPIFILIFTTSICSAQVSLKELSLSQGIHAVGFRHYLRHDSTRTYKRIFDWTNREIPRPIPISIWYPSEDISGNASRLKVIDYMEILKGEEEWEYLPNDQILNWFYYENSPENQEHLKEVTYGYRNAAPISSKFPVIIYAPSYQASSIENFALCEFLASHGYVVISNPSRGTGNRFFEGGTAKDMETQARDIEFLIKESSKLENVDQTKIATMGFSFGGLSNVLAQMRNGKIKANVSLDGSIRYQYATLLKSPFANIAEVDVPFIHMAQKEIPKEVLVEDGLDNRLNTEFDFFDDLKFSMAYSLRFHNLTHSYFSSLGVLFQSRDPRQDKSDAKIMESYRWMSIYSLNFLNAFLKDDNESIQFLENSPEKNGLNEGLVSINRKEPILKAMTFQNFNELAAGHDYNHLQNFYSTILKEDPDFEIPEGTLNNLGLQLVFNPKTSQHGIIVFTFATELYPESANLFDSLAEGYLFIGDEKMAIKSFKKSLELNPQNQNAIDRLKELGM